MKNPIRKHREKQGLKQLDLALLLGVTEMIVSHWERGARRPRDTMILKLAKIFKVDPETLTTELVEHVEEKRTKLRRRLRLGDG